MKRINILGRGSIADINRSLKKKSKNVKKKNLNLIKSKINHKLKYFDSFQASL